MQYLTYYLTIFIILLSIINCDTWYKGGSGYDTENYTDGYAGSSKVKIIDFYLCSKRKYRVHFLGDDAKKWSKEYSNCDPVGEGRYIDGISVDGEDQYRGRIHLAPNWDPPVIGNNISNNEYAGQLGQSLGCIAIDGEEFYRVAYFLNIGRYVEMKPSNPKNVTDRVIYLLLENKVKNVAEYDKTNDLDISINKLYKANIQLLNNDKLNINDGGIKIIFENMKCIYSFWGAEISNHLNNKLKDIINIDFNKEKKYFEFIVSNETIHGIVVIDSFWDEGRIQIDSGVKAVDNVESFRGGYRLNIFLKNNKNLIIKVKNIFKLFLNYIDIKEKKIVQDKLKEFNNITDIVDIINHFGSFNITITGIILLLVLKS